MRLLNLANAIPIGVTAAVGIFLLRELFELLRRRAASRRKLRAIHALVAIECERNAAAISTLEIALRHCRKATTREAYLVEVESRHGEEYFLHSSQGDSGRVLLAPPHTTVVEKYMFEAASLDPALFEAMLAALETAGSLRRYRSTLISLVRNSDSQLKDFTNGAFDQCGPILADISKLHSICTGGKELAGRL